MTSVPCRQASISCTGQVPDAALAAPAENISLAVSPLTKRGDTSPPAKVERHPPPGILVSGADPGQSELADAVLFLSCAPTCFASQLGLPSFCSPSKPRCPDGQAPAQFFFLIPPHRPRYKHSCLSTCPCSHRHRTIHKNEARCMDGGEGTTPTYTHHL